MPASMRAGSSCQPNVPRDFIGRFEADTAHILHQFVRVFLHDRCFIAVLFVNFDSEVCGNVVRLQEKHDIFDGAAHPMLFR